MLAVSAWSNSGWLGRVGYSVPAHAARAGGRADIGRDGEGADLGHGGAGDGGNAGREGAALGADADGRGGDLDVGAGEVAPVGQEEGGADAEVGVGTWNEIGILVVVTRNL